MDRISVSSSNLRSVGYDSDTQTLEIEFHYSGVYQYYGVPISIYSALMNSVSKGQYHNLHIKNHYRYKKVI